MSVKKVFIPMVEAGAGHKRTAMAIRDSLEHLYPGKFEIKIVDFARECGAIKSDNMMKSYWNFALTHNWFARLSFSLMEIFHPYSQLLLPIGFKEFVNKGIEYIKNFNPDIICSTHFWATSVSCMAREKLNLPIKVIGCVTDPFYAFSFWCEKKVDVLVVASEKAKNDALKHGIPENKIKILSFPIEKKFFNIKSSKEELFERYKLDKNKRTFIISFGGQGIGKATKYIIDLYKKSLPYNVIYICGKNEKLKKELEEMKSSIKSNTNLIVLGFVDNMNELTYISDFSVGKAGPSTIFESFIMGAPFVITGYSSIQELPNIDFVVKNKLGWNIKTEKEFFKLLDLFEKTNILEDYRNNIKNSEFVKILHHGADDIAKLVNSFLE